MQNLYLITNRRLTKGKDFFNTIKQGIKGGVDVVILREKDLDDKQLIDYARGIKEIIGNKDVKLIINGNLNVAKTVKADGYHMTFKAFLEKKPEDIFVGVSVHSLEEALICEEKGADYILVSHIYQTDCKKGLEPKGVNFIGEVKKKVSMPVIALGGIKPENVREVMDEGADGVAVMSYIMASDHPLKSAKDLKDIMNL